MTECPYCGQPLANKEAIRRLAQRQAEMEQKIAAEAKATVRKQLSDERARWEQQLRQEYARKEKMHERTLRAVVQQNEELKRRLEGLSASERGEAQEVDILGQLQSAFPGDKIERCGRREGDIMHVVRYQMGRAEHDAGIIVYECKDTSRWSNSFLTQIKRAGQVHKTPYLILVTHALPPKQKHFCIRDDVIVVHPSGVAHLVEIVRRMVIGVCRASRRAEDQSTKTSRLLEYLGSDAFKETFGWIVSMSGTLRDQLRAERNEHERVWTRREQAYAEIARKTSAVDEAIHLILEPDDGGRRMAGPYLAH